MIKSIFGFKTRSANKVALTEVSLAPRASSVRAFDQAINQATRGYAAALEVQPAQPAYLPVENVSTRTAVAEAEPSSHAAPAQISKEAIATPDTKQAEDSELNEEDIPPEETVPIKPRTPTPSPRRFGPLKPAEVIAVVNQKGGCGKTTTTINLSASLAKKGQRVLIIDMDPQAHATLGLGVKVAPEVKTVYEVIMEPNTSAAEAIHPTKMEGVHIIPGNTLLSSAQIDLLDWNEREKVLKAKLLPCLGAYQCVLIDCPPSLSILTLNALVAARRIIVPIQTHYFALDGMKQLFSTVEQVRRLFNPQLVVLGILTTMVSPRTNVCRDMNAAIRDYFKDQVFHSGIKMNVKLIECALYGESVITYAPQSVGALNYLELAEECLERLHAPVLEAVHS